MATLRQFVCATLTASLVAGTAPPAHAAVDSWEAVVKLRRDRRIEVTTHDGERIRGRLAHADQHTLTVEVDSKRERTLDRQAVSEVRRRGRSFLGRLVRGVLVGAGGLLLGGLIGLKLARPHSSDDDVYQLFGLAYGALIGAVVGLVTGLALGPYDKVVYRDASNRAE
jgi:small nuclear ribonucleoprotein (snRNP)-like protein